jgi:hypothetical protein
MKLSAKTIAFFFCRKLNDQYNNITGDNNQYLIVSAKNTGDNIKKCQASSSANRKMTEERKRTIFSISVASATALLLFLYNKKGKGGTSRRYNDTGIPNNRLQSSRHRCVFRFNFAPKNQNQFKSILSISRTSFKNAATRATIFFLPSHGSAGRRSVASAIST